MAQNIVTNYVGEKAQGYFLKSFKSGDTIGNGIITVKEKLKVAGLTMRTLDADDFIKAATCKFESSGDIDMNFRKLIGKKLQINLEICYDQLEATWEAQDMGAGADDNVPKEYIKELLKVIAGKTGEAVDKMIWVGQDVADEFVGILTHLANDTDFPSANKITGVTITPANVAEQIGKVADAIPDSVYSNDGDLVIAASSDITRAYMRSLGGFGAGGQGGSGYMAQGFVGKKPLDFEGIPIVKVGGLPKGTMVAYKVENVAFGTGLIADWTNMRVIDMKIVGDDLARIIGKFYGGTQYAYSEEIVVYNLPQATS